MQEKIIEEIYSVIITLLDNKDQTVKFDCIVKLCQLINNLKKMFPKKMLKEYLEFIDSMEFFLENCSNENFLNENQEILLSSLELLSECINEIKKYFEKNATRCVCCNSKVIYLPMVLKDGHPHMQDKLQRTEQSNSYNEENICPVCGASDRDRLILSFLQKEELQKAEENYSVLQIAPSPAISSWLQVKCPHIKCEIMNLSNEEDFCNFDIESIRKNPNSKYDLIIFSQEPAQVKDNKRILDNIKRILKIHGKCSLGESNWLQSDDPCVHQLEKEYFGEELFKQQGFSDNYKLYVLTKSRETLLNMAEKIRINQELLKNGPLVSVIMSCYNHEQFVEEAILSVLRQSYKNIEFIVADDGSKDNSAEIMKKYSQYFAYEYYSKENTGGLYNTIKKQATGKYIALMNSDDIWEADKIALQVEYMENHPECGVCLTWCKYVDENRNEIDDAIFIKGNRDSYQWMNYFWKHGNALCNPSFLATRKFGLEDVHFGAACRQLPDFFKWVQFIQETQIHIIPKVFVEMRRYRNKFSENASASTKENNIRHVLEAGCNWLWIIRQMDNDFFKKAFNDMMVNPNAETEEEIMCEKYFLMLNSENFAVQYEAFCYFNEIYNQTSKCFKEKYHYDRQNVSKDILNKGIGKLFFNR